MSCECGATSVPQFTTPTFTLVFDEESVDLTLARNVYVTFKNSYATITKSGNELNISPKQIEVVLTQQETGSFSVGKVEVQANWLTINGMRVSSTVEVVDIGKQLMQRVVDQ